MFGKVQQVLLTFISLVALAAIFVGAIPAHATTFNLSTLNDYLTGSGRSIVDHGDYTGLNGTGTQIFTSTGVEKNPWTEGTGASQASINFSIPGEGNNSSKIYMSAGALFAIPAGQTLGQNQSGYSGDYSTSTVITGNPLYFAFSNPTYDNNCGFNCNTITGVAVTMDSLDISGLGSGTITITGYSNAQTPNGGPLNPALDTMTYTGNGAAIQTINLDWTGIEQVELTGNSGYYLNNIDVNDQNVAPIPATPEPSSLFLLGTGLLGLGGIIRRRVLS